MSDFYGINIALTSLMAQRQAMETTGQNISNANTAGYSRQRVNLNAVSANTVPSFFSASARGGGGVAVSDIVRVRDAFLQARQYAEHATQQNLDTASQILGRTELVFSEPGPNGLQSQLTDFWNGWQDVMNQPDDLSSREQLVQRALTVANTLNSASSKLDELRQNTIEQMRANVVEINDKAAKIADLNSQIQVATLGKADALDLMDARDRLIDELSKTAGVTIQPGDDNQMNVFLGGSALVRGKVSQNLALDTVTSTPQVTFNWGDPGRPATITGGELGAMSQAVNVDLPGFQARFDQVASALATAVNTQHHAGYDLTSVPSPPNPATPPNGGDFFSGTTAATLTVNPAITGDVRFIAASSTQGTPKNGSNAKLVGALSTQAGGPDEVYRQMTVDLGVASQSVTRRKNVQTDITKQVDQASQADYGVSLDEEMSNLVMYQHAYDAAAKYLTNVDQMLDTLIRMAS